MEAQASCKYLRKTARKARLVADAVRGKMVGEALSLLQFSVTKGAAEDVAKVIKSAVANLQSRNTETSVNVDELFIKKVLVDQGPTLKRFRPRAQGRMGGRLKHSCHITVLVANQ
ncbi:MAG: 50S ribosomal protein L22 [Chitinivibrionales bacterium]|nr:50S ribosomal protein L22 [Chitinivibrionales bacterium]